MKTNNIASVPAQHRYWDDEFENYRTEVAAWRNYEMEDLMVMDSSSDTSKNTAAAPGQQHTRRRQPLRVKPAGHRVY